MNIISIINNYSLINLMQMFLGYIIVATVGLCKMIIIYILRGVEVKVKKTISPLLKIGLLIFVVITIVQRFITPISDWIAIPLLIVAIVLIFVGGFKTKEKGM